MKALACFTILFAGALAVLSAPAAGTESTFAVQLIRGTEHAKPDAPSWKPLDPTLNARFAARFRWDHWWEVASVQTNIAPGKTARVRLSIDREIDIARRSATETEVKLLQKGVVIQKSRRSSLNGRWMMGGTRENDESWFIVVTPPKSGADPDVVKK